MLKPVIIAASACAATLAAATPGKLSGQQVRELIAGATVEIDAPFGNKIPVRYEVDGQLAGQAGSLASYLGSPTDTGRWWITSDRLCHKWNLWFGSEPQCLRLSKEGRTIHWLNQDGSSGTAAISVPAQLPLAVRQVPTPQPAKRPAADAVLATEAPLPEAGFNDAQRPPQAAMVQPPKPSPTRVLVETPRPAARVPVAIKPTPSAQALPEPTRAGPPAFVVANVQPDDVLNVRGGPSTEFDIVGELAPGSRGVTIVGACRSEWCPVQHLSTNGWVHTGYLASDADQSIGALATPVSVPVSQRGVVHEISPAAQPARSSPAARDSLQAPRGCLTPSARALLDRIEQQFGAVQLVSTCRPGATIAGTGRVSRHASGNAVDFNAGRRKGEIINWLIANHRSGGTMTYPNMDHIHVDIGPHFVSIAGGRQSASWRGNSRDFDQGSRRDDDD